MARFHHKFVTNESPEVGKVSKDRKKDLGRAGITCLWKSTITVLKDVLNQHNSSVFSMS